MKKKIYIGIDPDLRLLNAALVTDEKKVLAVFARRNKGHSKDAAVANAARMACRLVEDVIAYLVANPLGLEQHEIHLVIESQNMEYTGRTNNATKDKMVMLCQTAGCLMGAFSNLSESITLVQPINWKGNVPKHIHHMRMLTEAGISHRMAGGRSGEYGVPTELSPLTDWSHDKINPGDFKDITDSIGLGLYGAKEDLLRKRI